MPRKASCMQVSLLQGSAQFGSLSMGKLLFFFFAAGSAQNGFVTGRVCFNELGLQCELQQDSLKGRGWFFGRSNGAFDSRWRRSRPSVNVTARLCWSLHTHSTHRQQEMLHLAMHEKAYGKSDIETSFRHFSVLRVHPGLVSSILESSFVFLLFFFLLFTQSTYRERERKKRKSTIEWLKLLWTENTMLYKPINIPSFDFLDYSLVLKRLLWLLSLPILFSPSPITR